MKTFKDLQFKLHPNFLGGKMARMNFDNGYGVSVINGIGSYTTAGKWEVAILKDDDLCYTSGITDDVIGYQSPKQVTEIMERVQSL